MNCPLCVDTVLDVTYHGGVELDICPTCRGVWLDRGELNRIVDEMPGRPDRAPTRDREHDGSGHRSSEYHKKRKKSFASRLGDAFEEIVDL